ncbi:uncharacterized protein LOC135391192 [Ornithodoros turicata]|uniref:uncharacterized protein LOC135391192 n=1 Tax=Ornithodoros turicata TaxID=34597 RepID=UPI003138DFBA
MDGCQIDEFAPSTSGAPRKVPSLGLSSQRKTAHLLAGMCSAEGFGDEAVRRSASPQFTNQWLPSQSAPNILNSKEANETVRCPEPCSSTLHLARLNDADENATLDSAQERVYDATQSFVAGEAVDSSSERNTTTESDSTQRTPPV